MNEMISAKPFIYEPTNFDELMRYAKLISESDLAPKDFKGKPGNTLIAIQMGAEIGLKPMQAIQNIAVINGRPSLWGDAMLAIVKAHPEFEDIDERIDNGTAYCTVKRRGQTPQTKSFSRDDAKKAGLLGKAGPWSSYESRMLQMRARGFVLRDVFPDALKGINLAEEAIDLPPEDYKVISVTSDDKKNDLLERLSIAKKQQAQQEDNVNSETGEILEPQANTTIPAVTLESIKEKINSAQNIDDLSIAADLANTLDEKEKELIREIYKYKKREIEQKV